MSNIPSTAIHAVVTPMQRATNEMLRARKVQADKASHHLVDVEEIDDTAVNSVDERRQNQHEKREKKDREEELKEKVEIAALSDSQGDAVEKSGGESVSHLDISA